MRFLKNQVSDWAKSIGATALLSLALAAPAKTAPNALASCFAKQDGETLRIGNRLTEISYDWNGGELSMRSITNNASSQTLEATSNAPDAIIAKNAPTLLSSSFSKQKIERSLQEAEHLKATLVSKFENFSLRRDFRVYPGSPFIGCDFYIKADKTIAIDPSQTILTQFLPEGRHWEFSAIEFFDKTDKVNNLIASREILSYFAPTKLRGNILFGRNLETDFALAILKEAPSSSSQLNYPGYDFEIDYTHGLKLIGAGITKSDIVTDKWIRIFGFAIGTSGPNEIDRLSALRLYQKQIRPHISERSDRIVMNTWGDRNGDTAINESFVIDQIDACAKLGIDILQLDDGWQAALSRNTKFDKTGKKVYWDSWPQNAWKPHAEKFPNGFDSIVDYAGKKGVLLGLWFHPSNDNDYEAWLDDAKSVAYLYKTYGIRYFKIDGIKLPTKRSEINLRKFFDKTLELTDSQVYFNLDLTADPRGGYHYLYDQGGNLFLENRYTEGDKRYFPHKVLRSLWDLAAYVPPESLQIQFLNTFRNRDKYEADDPFAPARYSFEYQFAATMAAQPLAWFEAANLPDHAFELAKTIEIYKQHREPFHEGIILPVGERPNGRSWTGFQSILGDSGYLLLFREWNDESSHQLKTFLPPNRKARLTPVLGTGEACIIETDTESNAIFHLPSPYHFVLYQYDLL